MVVLGLATLQVNINNRLYKQEKYTSKEKLFKIFIGFLRPHQDSYYRTAFNYTHAITALLILLLSSEFGWELLHNLT